MTIAFLGLGRMGRILADHLIEHHPGEVCVWNRTPSAAEPYRGRARVAESLSDACRKSSVVFTCLFGPEAVRAVMADPAPLARDTLWIDISTVGPIVATECAEWASRWGITYVHAPVLGSLGPAKAGQLGVLIGGQSAAARSRTRDLVAPWADPSRVIEYDSAAKAATGKLLVNLGLAVGLQAVIEALRVGQAGGLSHEEALTLAQLPKTPLSVIAAMKAETLTTGDYTDTQFSVNLLAKDVDLMLTVAAGESLPALTSAFAALEHARRAGHGEEDFAAMAG